MINLIPPAAKKQIVLEYWTRVVTTWILLFALVLLVGALLLFPVYVLVYSQLDAYRESAASTPETLQELSTVTSELQRASEQAKIAILNSRTETLSTYVSLFRSLESADVEISSVSLNRRSAGGVEPVQLVGVASDRQALASFRDRLLDVDEIASVDFPISNLAKESDIPFSITVEFTTN